MIMTIMIIIIIIYFYVIVIIIIMLKNVFGNVRSSKEQSIRVSDRNSGEVKHKCERTF